MGLKGYRLWFMGQLDSTCRAPPPGAVNAARTREVAVQLEFVKMHLFLNQEII